MLHHKSLPETEIATAAKNLKAARRYITQSQMDLEDPDPNRAFSKERAGRVAAISWTKLLFVIACMGYIVWILCVLAKWYF